MVMKYEIIAHSLNSLLYVYAQEYRSDLKEIKKCYCFDLILSYLWFVKFKIHCLLPLQFKSG